MDDEFVTIVEHRGGGNAGAGPGGSPLPAPAPRDLMLPAVTISAAGVSAIHAAGKTPYKPSHETVLSEGMPLIGLDDGPKFSQALKLRPNYARIRREAAAMAGTGGLLASSSDAYAEVGGVDTVAQSQGLTAPSSPPSLTFLTEGGDGEPPGAAARRSRSSRGSVKASDEHALSKSVSFGAKGSAAATRQPPARRREIARQANERPMVGGFAADTPEMQNAVLELLDFKDAVPTLARWEGQMHQPAFKTLKAPYMIHRMRIGKRRQTML